MIRFRCPRCDTKLEAPDHAAGKEVLWPSCRRYAYVPDGEPRVSTNRRLDISHQILWGACMAWTGLCIVAFWTLTDRAKSSVQEAAAAAIACLHVVAGYVATRAMERLLRPR
jgi:hypothetical protein